MMSAVMTPARPSSGSWLTLALFILVVIGVGGLIGYLNAPGEWYAELEKPPFNPPNWLFAPVWFTLYVMIAIAGWRTFVSAPSGPAMVAWWAQMLLNWAWTPVWFGLHLLWPAFAAIALLWLAILAFIVLSWRRGDRISAALFGPYLAWVSFASVLNLSIALLN